MDIRETGIVPVPRVRFSETRGFRAKCPRVPRHHINHAPLLEGMKQGYMAHLPPRRLCLLVYGLICEYRGVGRSYHSWRPETVFICD